MSALGYDARVIGIWPHQGNAGALGERFARDESWLMSTSSLKSLADHGVTPLAGQRPQTVASGGALSRSLSLSSHASMPSLQIKAATRNPVIGCLPDEDDSPRDPREVARTLSATTAKSAV